MRGLLVALMLWAGVPLFAAERDLPAIPPSVWTLTLPDSADTGSVTVERRLEFGEDFYEQYYLIRVLNEKGRGGVRFPAFQPEDEVVGRTLTKDGQETPFNSLKDFQTKEAVSGQEGSKVLKWVIPPGITSDCVVQLRARSRADFRPVNQYYFGNRDLLFWLGGPFPTRFLELKIGGEFAWGYYLNPGKVHPTVTTDKLGRTATFQNIPAFEEKPYSLALDRGMPYLRLFTAPRFLLPKEGEGVAEFWKNVADKLYKPYFAGPFHFGPRWSAFAQEAVKGLPSSPQEAARELYFRLGDRVRCLTAFTAEESAARTRKQESRRVNSLDLEESLKYGEALPRGMLYLYWKLLQEAGIPVKPVLLVNRDTHLLNLGQASLGQFEDLNLLIEEKGKLPMVVDPSLRIAIPGLVFPKYQATMALALLPGEASWSYEKVGIPAQPCTANSRTYEFEVQPGEDADHFSMRAEFSGVLDYRERWKYMRLLPPDRIRTLKENLENGRNSVSVTKAEFGSLTDARSHFWWRAEVTREREPSRRFEVVPFPFMPSPLWIPTSLPKERSEPIILDHLLTQTATSLVTVPRGFLWAGEIAPEKHQNAFGSVAWEAKALGTPGSQKVQVTYTTTVSKMIAQKDQYQDFKEFLSWISEANDKTLVFTRVAP